MSREEIFDKVRQVLAEQMYIDRKSVRWESTFADDLNVDSLDAVELIMALEKAFDMDIQDEDVKGINTVGMAVEYIEREA